MKRSLTRRLAILAAVAVLAGAACGGSDTATPERPTAAADKAAAERMVLTAADLPGFVLEPEDDGDEDTDSADFIDRCLKGDPPFGRGEEPRRSAATNFTQDDGFRSVVSGVHLAVTEAESRRAFSDFEDALSGQCLENGLKEAMEDSVDGDMVVGDVSMSPLPSIEVADEVAGTRVTMEMAGEGGGLSVHSDMIILRQGRVFGLLILFELGAPFSDSERIRLTTLLGDRMAGRAENTAAPDSPSPDSPSPDVAVSEKLVSFRDPSGVRLDHPQMWGVKPSEGDDPIFLFLDQPGGVPFRRNVNIVARTPVPEVTLDEFTEISLEEIRKIPGARIGESRPTTLSALPAYRVSYRAEMDGADLRFLLVWAFRGDVVWLVTYAADAARYDQGLPEVERVLTTVEVPA